MSVEEWLKIITGTGLGVASMMVGLRWLVKDRDGILAALQSERTHRIAQLERSSAACSEDRAALHAEVNELQREVRALMAQMIKSTGAGKCRGNCLTEGE